MGPFATEPFRVGLGLALKDAPPGIIQTPIGPLGVELIRRGHQVCAITLDDAVDAPCRVEAGDLTLVFLPMRKPVSRRSLDFFEAETRALCAEIDRFDPDVVHAHWTYEFAEAAVRSRRPHLATMHDIPLEIAWLFKNLYRTLRVGMAMRVMPRIRSLTVVSPRMVGWARLHGYFGAVAVVPNGVATPATVRSRTAAWTGDGPVIAMVGDTSARKNIAAGLAAFRLIRGRFPGASLHLFGGGLDAAYAAAEPGVVGHGPVTHDALMDFLAGQADLLIHPSLQETFGVIIAEALVRGVPAVAGAKSGGVRLVVGEALEHLLVDVRAPEAIFAKAAELFDDFALYQRTAEQGRRRVESQFSDRTMTTRFVELYDRAIAGRSAVRASSRLRKDEERRA